MRRLIISLWITLVCHQGISQCGNCETPVDALFNGDFEAGNIGFSSDHLFVPAPNILCTLCPEDRYAIGPNAQEYHNNFTGLDHTNPGTGNFMICNGDSADNAEVWCQTVNVNPLTFYTFSFWACNITDIPEPHPYAQLQIRINGVLLPEVNEIDGAWQQISAQWYTGNNSQLSLCIINQQSSGGGNDFGIDDISFYTCQPIEPANPAFLGTDQTICGGDFIGIGMAANANYSYDWIGLPEGYDNHISNHLISLQNTTSDTLQFEFVLSADTAGFCHTMDSLTITVIPFEPLSIATELIVCPYDSTEIILPGEYEQVLWSDGNSSSTRFLIPGEYQVVVSKNSCDDQADIIVSVPPDPQLSLGNDILGCSNQPPLLQTDFVGIWSDGSVADYLQVFESGQYSFSTNINGCEYADTINIDLFPVPLLDIGNDTVVCEGQTLALSAGDVWDFIAWSTGAGGESITVSQAGDYAVLAIIENCIARDTLHISAIDSILLDLGSNRELCEGDEIILTTQAPGIWNNNYFSDSLLISSGGQYSFTYSPGQCAQSDTIEVTVISLPDLNIGNDTSICAGAHISLSAGESWENVQWNNGSEETSILAGAGIVSVTASISTCTATDQIIIFPITPIMLDLGPDTTLCLGEILVLSTPATGIWNSSTAANEYSVTTPGTYTFVYGNEGCIQTDEILVSYDAQPTYDFPNDTTICRNSVVTLNAGSGWEEVLWNDANDNITITTGAGTYYLHASAGACTLNDTIQISEYNSPFVDLGVDTILCEGTSLTLQSEVTGLWNGTGPSDNFTITSTGVYIFEYADGLCAFADTLEADYIELPPLLPLSDTTICPWNEYTLQITDWPGSITWANGSNSFEEPMNQGGNIVTGQWNGCEITETFTLNYFPIEILPVVSDTVVCSNLGFSLSFEAPVQWSNGIVDNEILITVDGSYSYFAEAFGCIQTDTFQVSVQLEAATGLQDEIALCGDAVTIQTLIPGEWSDGQIGTTAIFETAGSYSFQVTDSACNVSYPVQIYLSEYPTITMEETVSFCEDASAEIVVDIKDALNYAWSDTTLGLTREITQPGVYTITAQNACGAISESIKAEVFPCNFGLFIPSAFTPNEDNINEGWRVQGFNLREIDIRVYNRLGDLVFATTDIETVWNPGLSIGDDVYNYRITAVTYDGKALREYGPIYLLR